MSLSDHWAERLIRKAQEEGQFDDLPGTGKPLDLSETPYEDPDMRMAHKILSNAKVLPEWAELVRQIDTLRESAQTIRTNYAAHRRWRIEELSRIPPTEARAAMSAIDVEREEVLGRLMELWRQINLKVLDLNVKGPGGSVYRGPVDVERERAGFEDDFPPLEGAVGRERAGG